MRWYKHSLVLQYYAVPSTWQTYTDRYFWSTWDNEWTGNGAMERNFEDEAYHLRVARLEVVLIVGSLPNE